MASLNKVLLMGNLTRDPEVRHTPKGTAVGDLAMAINMTYKAQDGTEKEEVCYVDVVVWGRQAETCRDYLTKGAPVFVEGRLQLDQWEGPEGEKKSRMRVRADRVQFLSRSGGGGGGGGARGPRSEGAGGGGAPSEGGAPKQASPPRDLPEDDVPF
jgi:single-strand DNA-binding protein